MQGFQYQPITDAPGDLYLYDVVQSHFEFRNQNVWARQLNVEGRANSQDATLPDQKILNDNSNVWVLGLKLENEGTVVRTINGGSTELLGVYRNNSQFSDAENPAFVTVESSASVINFDSATAAGNAWAIWASETRDGVMRTSARFDGGHVYSAFDDDKLWDTANEIVIDNLDSEASFQGQWQSSATIPGGFLDSDVAYSSASDATATFTPQLPVGGQYEVFVRWINNAGGQDHTGHSNQVPIEITHADGTDTTFVDQRINGGRWVSMGEYLFDVGNAGQLVIGTEGTTETSIVDGVRFKLRSTDSEIPTLSAPFPIQTATDVIDSMVFSGGEYFFDGDQGMLSGDSDRGGLPLTVSGVDTGVGGTVEFNADGSFTYSPQPWFTGWDSFTYAVTNGTETAT
ncbi:MAG: Ig-like domain-containing protein, partial [Planctomycetota bacterium]